MPKRALQAEDLLRLAFVSDVQLHPSGQRAVACVKTVRAPGAYRSRLVELAPGKPPREITQGDFMDTRPQWSPDGERLLFASNRDKPKPALYLFEGPGEPRRLTELPEGALGTFRWSPDGRQIAFLFRPQPEDRTKAAAESRQKEERSDPPHEIEVWPYRLDGDGLFNAARHRLYVLDVATGAHRELPVRFDDLDIDLAWHPDGKRLALAHRPGADRYLEPYTNEVFLVDIASGEATRLETPTGEKTRLSFSPDGNHLAFVMSERGEREFGPKRDEIGILRLADGRLTRHLADEDLFIDSHVIGDARDPAETRLFWTPDGRSILFHLGEGGHQGVARLDVASGKLTRLTPDVRGEIHLCSLSADGTQLGLYFTTPTRPAEAAIGGLAGDTLTVEPVSAFNEEWVREFDLAEPEEVWLESSEGTRVQAWVLKPAGFDPGKKYRAAIEVHGGPMSMYTDAFFFEMQLLAANGFVVFFSNPRGSTGYGEAFCRAIIGDWGNRDWDDVRTLTHYARSQPYIDESKVCILGGSYGGYMVNWAIGHSDEYYRAVTDRCVSNLLSKWGNSDYLFIPDGHWPGSAFGDYAVLWDRSPVKHFRDVRTPTLIIHSEGDLRCHVEQGEQVYAALKILGVETKFIRYPISTSHGLSRSGPPDLRVHRLKAIVDWLSR